MQLASIKNAVLDGFMRTLGSMTARQERLVAVDIRPGVIYLAQLEQQGKNDWVVGHIYAREVTEEPVDEEHIRGNVPLYATTLSQMVAKHKIDVRNVAISLPVASSIVKMVDAPLMSEEELYNAIELDSLWENLVQVAGSMDDYSIYWQEVSRDVARNSLTLLFIASKLSEISVFEEVVRTAGLQPVLMDVRCLSLLDALPFHFGPQSYDKHSVAIVELGSSENYLMIAEGESVYVADIFLPASGRETLLKKDLDDSEIQTAMSRYAAQLRQALLQYHSKTATSGTVSHVLFVSSLPLAERYVQALNDSFNDMELALFNPLSGLTLPAQFQNLLKDDGNMSAMAPVLALAKRKLDVFGYFQYVTGAQNVNLLPARESMVRSRKTQFYTSFITALVLLVGLAFFVSEVFSQSVQKNELVVDLTRYHQVVAELDQLNGRLEEVRARRAQLSPVLSNSTMTRSDLKERQRGVLAALSRVLPFRVWLSKILIDEERKVYITGRSYSGHAVPRFVESLNQTEQVEGVTLLNIKIENSKSGVSVFELQGQLATSEPGSESGGAGV